MTIPSNRLALIAGPTASGKSALALALAERVGGTIVNADASQVYRDLRILSARPTPDEEARAPHRLFGYRDGADPCSAADWAADARAAIAAVQAAGGVPILVGGTGLYVRTLLEGIAPVPDIAPDIRADVRALPLHKAFAALGREDPEAAARLRPSDTTRVARALEVVRSTGRTLTDWQTDRVGGIGKEMALVPLILLPDREILRARIANRFAAMMAGGAEDEVAALVARGLDPELPVMRAIGVRDIAALLAGEIDRDTAEAGVVAATRRYAKRQRTWFAHQSPTEWPKTEQVDCAVMEDLVTKLQDRALTD